jgi:serine/threonine protein kinase
LFKFSNIFFTDIFEKGISEGSFGCVCCASNIKSKEKIAIKFYKKQESTEVIEQEIKVGFDKRLICPYIMTFKNDFTFSNEETDGEFRCVSMELMSSSLESLLKPSINKDSAFPLRMLFTIDTPVYFILFIYLFCHRRFCISSHRSYWVLEYFILTILFTLT